MITTALLWRERQQLSSMMFLFLVNPSTKSMYTNVFEWVNIYAGQLVWHLSQITWSCTCGSLLWMQAGCQRSLVSCWNTNPFNVSLLALYIQMLIIFFSWWDRCVHWCSGCNWYQPHAQQRASTWRRTVARCRYVTDFVKECYFI